MLFLCVRTDSPVAELYLYEGGRQVADYHWRADREMAKGLLAKIEAFLSDNDTSFSSLGGIVAFQGPGSFTGLRIGLTVCNTLAYSLSIPIVGRDGDHWAKKGVSRLISGHDDQVVMPHYGADPRITRPKK